MIQTTTLRIPSVVAVEICDFLPSLDDRFAVASLLRVPRIQAVALLLTHGGRHLDFCHDTAVLDLYLHHLPRDLLHKGYTSRAVDYAGSVRVLQWWKDSGLEFRYTESAIAEACTWGRIDVLQWWKDSGLPLKYDESSIQNASACGQIKVLQWWKDSGLQLKYDKEALNSASRIGRLRVLQWWRDSGLPLVYDGEAMDRPSEVGQIDMLDV